MKGLRIPLVLSVVAMTTATVITAINCGHGESPPFDANQNCAVFCFADGSGSGEQNCPFPTCATGSNLDQCPAGCSPEPIV